MTTHPALDPETAETAEHALLAAIADLLEQAVEHCAHAEAMARLPALVELCRDAALLGAALGVIGKRSPR